ncbi:hypothetical protein M1D80_11060 [Phyllobacteriaceae bacterium JZ32]
MSSTLQNMEALDLNEQGDFLAGLFAPVAFLWLAAAVFIQAQELSAQRDELKQTRLEVRQNREVAMAQADEARKTSEYIGKQTELLVEQQVFREQSEAAILLQKKLESLYRFSSKNMHLLAVITRPNGKAEQYAFNVHCRGETDIRRFADNLQHSVRSRGTGAVELRNSEVLQELWERFHALEEVSLQLKEADRIEYKDLGVTRAIDALDEFAKLVQVNLPGSASEDRKQWEKATETVSA